MFPAIHKNCRCNWESLERGNVGASPRDIVFHIVVVWFLRDGGLRVGDQSSVIQLV